MTPEPTAITHFTLHTSQQALSFRIPPIDSFALSHYLIGSAEENLWT